MTNEISPKDDPKARVIFSAPELLAVRRALQQTVQSQSEDGAEVWFNAILVDEHIEAELRFADLDRTRVLTMHAVTPMSKANAKELLEARVCVVEFIGGMFEEWLEQAEHRSPEPDWAEYEHDDRKFMFRGTLLNEKIESDADAFLREHGVDPEQLYEQSDDILYADEEEAEDEGN